CDRLDGLPSRHGHADSYFSANIDLFRRYVQWLMRRLVRGRARTSLGNATKFAGWRSEHSDAPASIQLWYTSQAMLFLAQYAGMLQEHLATRALQSAGLSAAPPSPQAEGLGSWVKISQEMEPVPGRPTLSAYRYWRRIGDGYVSPRSGSGGGEQHYSMLL